MTLEERKKLAEIINSKLQTPIDFGLEEQETRAKPIKKRKKRKKKFITYYCIYDAKTDELLATGTTEEICKQMGWCRKTASSMISRIRRGLSKSYEMVEIKEKIDEQQ